MVLGILKKLLEMSDIATVSSSSFPNWEAREIVEKVMGVRNGKNGGVHKKNEIGHQFLDSFVNSCIKDTVKPKIGSVVHCGLVANQVEHSGIYVGYNKIIHLDGSGKIESVTPAQFLDRLGGLNMALNIYVSCVDDRPVGSRAVANRARAKLGRVVKYNVLRNNCHMFSSGCLSGDFSNNDFMFGLLEETAGNVLGMNEWRVWDFN